MFYKAVPAHKYEADMQGLLERMTRLEWKIIELEHALRRSENAPKTPPCCAATIHNPITGVTVTLHAPMEEPSCVKHS